MQIYIDESENPIDGTLVIAAVVTERPKELANVMERARKGKLPKKLRHKTEIKASEATDKFKRYFYSHLAKLSDARVYAISIDKSKIPPHLHGKEGLLYVRMLIRLLEACPLDESNQIFVYPDHRQLKGVSQAGFLTSLHQHFGVKLEDTTRFEVYPRDSQADLGVQVADFVANAIYQHIEQKNDEWYGLIQPLIERELNAVEVL